LCRDETRTSEHIGISPAEEGWTVANDNERYLVAALTCNVLQHLLPLVPIPALKGRPIPVAQSAPSHCLQDVSALPVICLPEPLFALAHTLHRTALHPPAAGYPLLPIGATGTESIGVTGAKDLPPIGAKGAANVQLTLDRKWLTTSLYLRI
jgi:hypothetical protein